MRGRGLVFAAFLLVLAAAPPRPPPTAEERALAERYAPVVRLVEQVGIGLAFVPVAALITGEQALIVGAAELVGIDTDGESGGVLAVLVGAVGTVLAVTGLALVQAATVRALVELDRGRPIGPLRAFRLSLARFGPMLGAVAVAVAVVLVLSASVALLPLAVWLVGRWALLAQAVELEDASPQAALRRSSELVRGRWLKVVSLVVVGAVIAFALGPLIGALLIFVTDVPSGSSTSSRASST